MANPREDHPRPQPLEDWESVVISNAHPYHPVWIGTSLGMADRKALITFLRTNSDCFALSYADVPGIDPCIITHRLGISLGAQPIR